MSKHQKMPGVSREQRIGDDGLQRLEKQLIAGTRISTVVLAQWVKRYGDAAKELIRLHGQSYQDKDNNE